MNTPLRIARKRASRNLDEVSKALGMSEATLSRIESGKQKASPEQAERLARYWGTVSEIEILYPERFTAGDEGRAA